MATNNLAEAANIMREILAPDIKDYMNREAILWNLMMNGEAEFVHSLGVQWVATMRRNANTRYYAEAGGLGSGGKQTRERLTVTYTRVRTTGSITGDVLRATTQDALVNGMTGSVEEDTKSAVKFLNEDLYEDGSGVKAVVAAAPSGTLTIACKGPFGAERLLETGWYNIYSPSGTIKTANFTSGGSSSDFYLISKVRSTGVASFGNSETDLVADSITTNTIAEDDIIVPKGGYGIAVKGLRYHANDDSGSYQGKSRATYPDQLRASVTDMANAALTVAAMDQLEAKILFRMGASKGFDQTVWLCGPTQLHAYKQFGYNDTAAGVIVKKFEGAGGTLDLGYSAITHNGRQFILDTDCPGTDLHLTDRTTYQKFENKPLGPLDVGDLLRPKPSMASVTEGEYNDEYLYTLNWQGELGNKNIRANGRLKNLSYAGLPTPMS